MADVVKICGVAKDRIVSICGVKGIKRVIGIDFLVIIFGAVMSFLVPSEIAVDDIHTIDGDTVVSGDGDKWIATVSKDHVDGKQLVSGTPEALITSELPLLAGTNLTNINTSASVKVGTIVVTDVGIGRITAISYAEAVYSATVTGLTGIPAKAFADPSQGEIVNVDVTTTATSLVSSDELIEGQEVDTDKKLGVTLGAVASTSEDQGTITENGTSADYAGGAQTKYQSFLALGTTLESVSFSFHAGGATGDKTFYVRADDGGTATGNIVGSGTIPVPASGYGTAIGLGITLVAGTRYWVGFDDTSVWLDTTTARNYTDGFRLQGTALYSSGSYLFTASFRSTKNTADITAAGLASAPTHVSRKAGNIFVIGVGKTGEYVGKPIDMTLVDGESTKSLIVTTSNESTKDKQFLEGGLHNNLSCTMPDGSVFDVKVASVSEETTKGAEVGNVLHASMPNGTQIGGLSISIEETVLAVIPPGRLVTGVIVHPYAVGTVFGALVKTSDDVNYHIVRKSTVGNTTADISGKTAETIPVVDFLIPDDRSKYYAGVFFSAPSTNHSASHPNKTNVLGIGVEGGTVASLSTHLCGPIAGYVYKDQIVKTISTLVTPLALIPTSVKISSRLLNLSDETALQIGSEGLKLIGKKIVFSGNPDLRSMAMGVKLPAGTAVKDFKITPECMG